MDPVSSIWADQIKPDSARGGAPSTASIADIGELWQFHLMTGRLTGIVATLWFFFALLSLFIALAFSPLGLRLLLPNTQPSTWVYPVLLALPPIVLGFGRFLGPQVSSLLLWPLAATLGMIAMLLFGFLAAAFVGH